VTVVIGPSFSTRKFVGIAGSLPERAVLAISDNDSRTPSTGHRSSTPARHRFAEKTSDFFRFSSLNRFADMLHSVAF
jgi:hypothetical protein